MWSPACSSERTAGKIACVVTSGTVTAVGLGAGVVFEGVDVVGAEVVGVVRVDAGTLVVGVALVPGCGAPFEMLRWIVLPDGAFVPAAGASATIVPFGCAGRDKGNESLEAGVV